MEDLLARYFDGELDEEQAQALLRAAEDDPAVEAALRDHETLLEAAGEWRRLAPPAGFADRVMARIERGRAGSSRRLELLWPAAAALVLGLALGYLASQVPLGHQERPAPWTAPARMFLADAAPTPETADLQAVRLVYVPTSPDTHEVTVAGDFNGWDPSTARMTRDGNAWSILLVLPPGVHEYMIVEDGRRWITDPSAPRTRGDGFGGENGLLDVHL